MIYDTLSTKELCMTKTEAISYFGSIRKLAEALGLSTQAVAAWGETIPKLREYEINDILQNKAVKDTK